MTRGHKFERDKERYMGRFGGRKGKGDMIKLSYNVKKNIIK